MFKALSLPLFGSQNTRNQRARPASRTATNHAAFWLGTALLVASAVLLISYVSGVNSGSLRGYEIKQLQNKIAVLSDQNKTLNFKIAEASSILSIQNDFLNSNFVAMGTPQFLEVATSHFSER